MVKFIENLLNALSILLVSYLKLYQADIYVCECADPQFLGAYSIQSESGRKMDGVHVFTNANDMSFFRNKGFWYLGDYNLMNFCVLRKLITIVRFFRESRTMATRNSFPMC